MATISGRVYYSSSSYTDADDGTRTLDNYKVCIFARGYLKNIPIVLVNNYGVGVCVLSDSSGNCRFDQIPVGNYRIVEAFGRTDGVSSSFVYTNSSFKNLGDVMASDPTIDYIDSLGFSLNAGNKIISISPNTL